MTASREMARVSREVEALRAAVEADLKRGRDTQPEAERRALRSEIEAVMQTLDELRGRLAG